MESGIICREKGLKGVDNVEKWGGKLEKGVENSEKWGINERKSG